MRSRSAKPSFLFVGSGDFAAALLREMAEAGYLPRRVLTLPDRPAGRGRRPRPTPCKAAAMEAGLTLTETSHPGEPAFREALSREHPEVVLVSDYRFILPREILEYPPRGCVNVHPSLLPRHRGAAPIRRALMEGDDRSGVSLMLMDEGMDTGPIIAARDTAVEEDDDERSLRLRLAAMGASLLEDCLYLWVEGSLEARPQGEEGASYAPPIHPGELLLDWTRPAREVFNRVRALAPRPGAYTYLRGRRLKILRAVPERTRPGLEPGVLSPGGGVLLVGTGEGTLRILLLQPEGKREMSAEEFLRGYRPAEGERLGKEPA